MEEDVVEEVVEAVVEEEEAAPAGGRGPSSACLDDTKTRSIFLL
jgi:hypothetical protein